MIVDLKDLTFGGADESRDDVAMRHRKETQMLTWVRMVLRDERGIETLEWILIGALITAVGLAVYPGTLQDSLTTAVSAIGGKIVGALP